MATSSLTVSGVLYDGAGTNIGADVYSYSIQNTTPPAKVVTNINTSTTTNITVPTNAKAAIIACNLSAGSVTVGGQSLGPISTSVIDFEGASGGTLVIVTTAITGNVEVKFV